MRHLSDSVRASYRLPNHNKLNLAVYLLRKICNVDVHQPALQTDTRAESEAEAVRIPTVCIYIYIPFPLPLLVARSIWCLPYPASGTLTTHCKGSAPHSSLPAPYGTYRIRRAGFLQSFRKAVLHVSLWPRSHIYMSYSITHFSAPIYYKSPTSLPCMAETCTPLQ